MKKINHPILIISIASALVILGISIALGLRYSIAPGLLTGVCALTLLISFMLFANRRMNRKSKKKK